MFKFFRPTSSGRYSRRYRVASLTLSTVLMTAFIPTMLAPAASAGDGAQTVEVTDSEGPKGKGNTEEPDEPEKPNPTKNNGVVTTTIDKTLVNTTTIPFDAWFYERSKQAYMPYNAGSFPVNFDSIALTKCTAHTPADDGYGYGGNGIPLPGKGQAAQTMLTYTSWTTKTEYRETNYTYVETFTDTFFDPVTGETTLVQDTVRLPSKAVRYELYFYNIGCNYSTAPTWELQECPIVGAFRIMGPYDQSWNPMKSVKENGTNTRVPDASTGEIGVTGKTYTFPSTPLGADTQRDMNVALPGLKTVVITPNLAWSDCMPPSGVTNSYAGQETETTSSLGRYIHEIDTWRTHVWYRSFGQNNWKNIWKAEAAKMGATSPTSRELNGQGWQLLEITAPVKTRTYDYVKEVCKSGANPNGTVSTIEVAMGVSGGRDSVTWGDSNPEYYTWNCGDNPGAPTSDDTAATGDDLLQCDTYDQTSTMTRNVIPVTTTTTTGTRWAQTGWNYSWGCSCGGKCGNWSNGDPYCQSAVFGWENYSITTENPGPGAGYSRDGSNWRQDCPTGWSVVSPTECTTTQFSDITVDGKSAAPLASQPVIIVEGETQELVNLNGVYQVPSTADPIHAEWQRIRINTRDGRNINTSGKNVTWEYNYKLAPWSSPMLKGTDVNDRAQPYHGWVDNSGSSVDAGEIPLDTKWEPDKFYEYKNLPYTYSYKSYTYSTVADYKPYTYRSETYASGTYSYACGTYTYQSGSESYQCGGGYSYVSSGGATYYWWANGGAGGYACPGGWWLSGSTCYTNTYVPPQYCSRPTYSTGTNYCTGTSYSTRQVKNSPPSGYFDNGSQYQRNTQVKNPPPAGYIDNGTQYQKTNPAPTGYSDTGSGYISNGLINDSGKTGGIAFNKWRSWPSTSDQEECTIDMGTYSDALAGQTFKVWCGDNVTDNIRGAYFRFFQSSTAGSGGWRVTPWAKVTADVQTDFSQISGWTLNTNGTLSPTRGVVSGKYVRQSYECPAQSLTFNIERVVG